MSATESTAAGCLRARWRARPDGTWHAPTVAVEPERQYVGVRWEGPTLAVEQRVEEAARPVLGRACAPRATTGRVGEEGWGLGELRQRQTESQPGGEASLVALAATRLPLLDAL